MSENSFNFALKVKTIFIYTYMNLQEKFRENEWNMLQYILENGRNSNWLTLAFAFDIKPSGTPKQRRTAANDVYRRYLRLTQPDLAENTIDTETTVGVSTEPELPRILIYDIETARMQANVWWSGQQYINGNSITSEPRIITIAYKWLGEDEVHYLKWNKKQNDKKLLKEFLKEYNQADLVIGFNNDKFDNRYINTRALRHDLEVNTHVKSLDLMKEAKRLFRLPSYSMNYIARYLGLETKLQHSGLSMWEAIQYGSKKEAKEAMKLMIEYNVQDIIVTEQVYLSMRKYLKHPIHAGVTLGSERTTCPICGSEDIELFKTTTSASGTITRIMKCKEDGHLFKLSNSQYLKWNNN